MNPERTTVSQTVVISDMTSEQLQAFFSGSMTWEEAHALFPGKPITITEVEPEEFENV
tara:strand:+ start:241 stop:414 length:174 start_codon:yes stop_codon:yes gene_type:complete